MTCEKIQERFADYLTGDLDEAGRLLFFHADGRMSARFDEVEVNEGLLRFEGPFLFRDGIAHIPGTDRYLVTGKWWPTMYEVRIS